MHLGLKSLDSRGEYLVDLMEDGYPTQFVGRSPDGVSLFRAGGPQFLDLYQERLAVVEPQWTEHVEARLHD
jgi:hypothetical protein